MKNIFYLILLLTIGVNAQTYAPSAPIVNGNVRITNPPTAQPANQPYVLLWSPNAPYNVLGKYLFSDLLAQYGTTPTLQQVLTAGSTANITSPFIVNYKSGTPQAVELSINDANFQVGIPNSNNTLNFDDSFVGFSRPVNGIDAVTDTQFITLGQLNNAIAGIQPPNVTLQQATDNGNSTTNDIILDAENTQGIVSILGAYGGVLDNSRIEFNGDGTININSSTQSQELGANVAVKDIRFNGGNKISALAYAAPTNDFDFAQKKYVDDAIAGATGNQNMQTTFNNGSQVDMGGEEVEYYNGQSFNIDVLNLGLGSNDPTSTTNLRSTIITANNITENPTSTRFVVQDNTGRLYFRNGTTATPTNLSYTASGTNGVVNNSNGIGFTIPAVTSTFAGLQLPGDYTRLLNTSGTNTGNEVQATETTAGKAAIASASETTTGTDNTKIITPAKLKQIADTKIPVTNVQGIVFYNPANNTSTAISGNAGMVVLANGTTININSMVNAATLIAGYSPTPGIVAVNDSYLAVISKLAGNQLASSNTSSKTASYTLTATDYKVKLTSGTATFTLPTAVGISGKEYVLKNSGTGVLTVATTSGQTIDGMASYPPINVQYKGVRVQSDGANWDIIGQF